MTIKTPYKSEIIEEIKVNTSTIDDKIDVVDGLVDTLIARLTSTRAGYLDNINNANLATLPAISSTRIGYLDNLSGGAVALNSTVAKEATLTHATYGLDKIKTETASLVGKVDVIDGIVDSIVAKTNLIGASVAPADEYDTEMARITGNVALEATLTAIKGSGWSTQTLVALSSAINGLNDISASDVWSVATRSLTDKVDFALSTAGINAIRLSVCLTGDTANSIGKILYDFYNTRLGATRCGYLDLLVNGTYGLAALDTDLGTIITNVGTVDTVVDAIKAKTDLLFSGIATEAKQNTIIGYIDTEVGAIKAKTDLIGASVALSGEYTSALGVIDGYFDVPTADATTDATIRDIIGRKTDTANTTVGTTSSLMRYIKGILGEVTSGTYGLSVIEGLVDDLEGRLTATRAGYLDYLANGTYGLSALNTDLDSIISSLANATYGLSAIKTSINAIPTTAMRGTDNAALASVWTSTRGGYIDTIKTNTDKIGTIVNTNGTATIGAILGDFANSTLIAKLNAIPTTAMRGTDGAALASVWTSTRGGYVDLLANATYGLNAIKTAVNAIPTTAMRGTDNAALASVWTSTRGGYIDYLANGTYGLSALNTDLDTIITNLATVDTVCDNIYSKVDTEIATIDTVVDAIKVNTDKLPRLLSFVDSWGTNNAALSITTTAGTLSLTSNTVVVAGIPTSATVTKVVALLKIASITDTSGSDNAIVGSTMVLQCDAASGFTSPTTAISIPDNSWAIDVDAGQTRGGDAIIGSADIKAEVTGNGTYYFRFVNADCDGNNLILNDVLVGLRVYFTI